MKNKERDKRYLNLFHECAESVSTNPETATEYLNGEGVDLDLIVQRGLKSIRKIEFLTTAKAQKAEDEKVFQIAYSRALKKLEENKNQPPIFLINALKMSNPRVLHRNLEKLNQEELKEILHEVDLVKFIEEIEKNPKND